MTSTGKSNTLTYMNIKPFDVVVAEVVAQLKTGFSVWDVTRVIRQNVNAGEYLVDGLAQALGFAQEVPKNKVRDEVLKLFHDNKLTRMHNGNYFVYSVVQNVTAQVVNSTSTPVAIDDDLIKSKIHDYLSRRDYATLKQIQSTLRRYGHFTCEQLHEILAADTSVDMSNGVKYSKVMARLIPEDL